MLKEKTEICIVGGGPGGVFLAAYLNQNKIPHILVEAKEFPRTKPCGDTISIHIVNEIKKLLPEAYLELKPHLKVNPIKGVRYYPPNQKGFNIYYLELDHFNGEPSSYMIKREVLDEILLKQVSKLEYTKIYQPYEITDIDFFKNHVLVKGKNIEINCDAVLVASGCKSSLASKFTQNQPDDSNYALGLRAYFKNIDIFNNELAELHIYKETFFGGLYLSSIGNNVYNVNVVMNKGSLKEKELGFRKLFFDLIEQHPILHEKFKHAELIGSIEGHPLLLGTKKRKLSHKKALFIGDAAGLIDLITANGIPQAMKSARIAVNIYLKAKKENNIEKVFSEYDKQIYLQLKQDLAASKILKYLISSKILKKLLFLWMRIFMNEKFVLWYVNYSIYRQPFLKKSGKSIQK